MSTNYSFSPYQSEFSQQMMKLIKSDFKKVSHQTRYPTPLAQKLLPQIQNHHYQRASINYAQDYEFPKLDLDRDNKQQKLQRFIEAREQASLYQTKLRLQNKKKQKKHKSEEPKKQSNPLTQTVNVNDITTVTDKQSQNRSIDIRVLILNSQQEKPRKQRFDQLMSSNMNKEFYELKTMMKNLQKARKKNDLKLFNRIKGKISAKTQIEPKQVHFTQ